jgi:hypothetical protein
MEIIQAVSFHRKLGRPEKAWGYNLSKVRLIAAPIKQPNSEEYILSLLSVRAKKVNSTPNTPKMKPTIKDIQ